MLLSFLNLGPTEVFLVLVLFVLLFGAQKVPEMARALGRAKAEMDRAQREIKEAITPQEDRALAEQLAFERMREEHVRAQQEDPEMTALERAAGELGLVTAGMTKEQLRAAIAAKVSDGGSAGSGKGAENAAGAQQ